MSGSFFLLIPPPFLPLATQDVSSASLASLQSIPALGRQQPSFLWAVAFGSGPQCVPLVGGSQASPPGWGLVDHSGPPISFHSVKLGVLGRRGCSPLQGDSCSGWGFGLILFLLGVSVSWGVHS